MRTLFGVLVLLAAAHNDADGCPRIISRAEWGARPPTNSPTPLGDNVSSAIQLNHLLQSQVDVLLIKNG